LPNHVKYCVSVLYPSYEKISVHPRSAHGVPESPTLLPSDKILCTGLYLNKMVGKLVTGFMLLDIQRFWYDILS
jgi:hypothetical protein